MKKLSSRTKIRLAVIAVLIIAVLLGFTDYPTAFNKPINFLNEKMGTDISEWKDVPFHLGLDLQGGVHLVYEADMSGVPGKDQGDSVEGVRDVIERRVNAFGVAEPVIQTNQAKGKWRVIVELAGVKDVDQAIQMIGETPLLEFKTQNEAPPRDLTPNETQEMNKYNVDAKTKAQEVLQKALAGEDFVGLVKEYSEDAGTKDFEGDLGYLKMGMGHEELVVAAKDLEEGAVVKKLVEKSDGISVVKLVDKRDDAKEVYASHILICYEGADRCENERSKKEAKQKIAGLASEATVENFADLAKEHSDGPSGPSGGDLGWFGSGQMVPEFDETVFVMENDMLSEVVETQFGFHLIYKADERAVEEYQLAHIYLDKKTPAEILPPQDEWLNTELTGKNLKKAWVDFDQNTGIAEVALEFDKQGGELFAQITQENVGKLVAIFLDGQPISVPKVQEEITSGSARITGTFTIQEAKLLSQRLNAGALPVPINLMSQQVVGASLGQESVSKSLTAAMWGFIIILIFMLFVYRLPGLLADFALIIYGIIILFLFKMIPVTLTLSGIAGFILSIGMAVDANVLIFERLKEELRAGKPLSVAIDEAFKRAWPSIRDGNVSTLITCFILAWFGTSIIKGFAITLGVGVLVSMFSAIVITRLFLKVSMNPKKDLKRKWLFGIK